MGYGVDDIVRKKRGRPFRHSTMSDAMASGDERCANGPHCRDCPKFGRSWCKVSARVVAGGAPACKYGKVMITAARRADKERRRVNGERVADKKWTA